MFGINFKDDSWRNINKKAKSVKDQNEQNAINQAAFDYIRVLQMQIDDIGVRLRELEERDKKKRFGNI